jgi:DNA-binding CsgD family transcriptional regulator
MPREVGDGDERRALSAREREVLRLVASGARDDEIATTLHISVHTVHSHLDRIRDKTGHRRRADLTRLAFEHGIVTHDTR